jgi:hypothetical protein
MVSWVMPTKSKPLSSIHIQDLLGQAKVNPWEVMPLLATFPGTLSKNAPWEVMRVYDELITALDSHLGEDGQGKQAQAVLRSFVTASIQGLPAASAHQMVMKFLEGEDDSLYSLGTIQVTVDAFGAVHGDQALRALADDATDTFITRSLHPPVHDQWSVVLEYLLGLASPAASSKALTEWAFAICLPNDDGDYLELEPRAHIWGVLTLLTGHQVSPTQALADVLCCHALSADFDNAQYVQRLEEVIIKLLAHGADPSALQPEAWDLSKQERNRVNRLPLMRQYLLTQQAQSCDVATSRVRSPIAKL